jgi:hypothetical protein
VTFAGDLDALCKVEEQVTGAKQSASRVALQEAAHLGEGTMNVQRTDGCEEREFHVVLQGQHLVAGEGANHLQFLPAVNRMEAKAVFLVVGDSELLLTWPCKEIEPGF